MRYNGYRINKYTIYDYIGIILFKIILDYSYINFVQKYFSYDGYIYQFDMTKYLIGWAVLLISFYLLLLKKNNTIYIVLVISFLLLIPPATTLFAFDGKTYSSFFIIILFYDLMLLLIVDKKIRIKYIKSSYIFALVSSVIFSVAVLFHLLLTVGVGHINFDLSKVYELRREFGSATNSGIFGYLNSWVFKVFNILMIGWSLHRKRYYFTFLFVAIQVLLFGLAGHKSIIVTMLLVFGIYYFDRFKYITIIVLYFFIFLLLVSLSIFYIFDNPLIPSIIIRRAFIVPVDLNYVYLDFFSHNPYVMLSDGILKSIFDYPYSMPATHVVGAYLGYPDMAANTGFIGSGYMNFGIFGIFLYTIILAFLINVVNSLQKLPKWLVNVIVLMPLLSALISSDLPTTLLTHGLLVSVLMVYLYGNIKSFGRKPYEQK